MTITQLFLKGRDCEPLTQSEHEALDDCINDVIEVGARRAIHSRPDSTEHSHYLVDGCVARYLSDRRGYRQSVGIQIPGDWIDLHSFPLKRLDHDVVAIAESQIAVFSHRRLRELIGDRPEMALKLWFATLLDAALLRESTFRLGRLPAEARFAHLLCELITRYEMIGRFDAQIFPAPMNQSDFSEACGVSVVHANRSFRELRKRGFVGETDPIQGMPILDREGLCGLSEFREDYLYPARP